MAVISYQQNHVNNIKCKHKYSVGLYICRERPIIIWLLTVWCTHNVEKTPQVWTNTVYFTNYLQYSANLLFSLLSACSLFCHFAIFGGMFENSLKKCYYTPITTHTHILYTSTNMWALEQTLVTSSLQWSCYCL